MSFSRAVRHSGNWSHPADPLRCWPFLMIIKSAESFSDKNCALCRGTSGSLSPWITTNCLARCCIISKWNSDSRKLSNFLFWFLSEGEATRMAPEIGVSVCSKNLRIAGPPSECPTRYISSSWVWITWRSISCTHSAQIGFSGVGIGRAHAYISRFSSSAISQGLHPPFGLHSKPWMRKTFFIIYFGAQGGGNLP